MNKLVLPILAGSLFLASCQDAPKADNAEATEAQEVAATEGKTYNADLSQSKVEWVGTKPVGKHHGTINITEGMLTVNGNAVTGGKYVLDMNSLVADDQDAEGNTKLTGHLKSEDFFNTGAHPTGTFEITSITEGVTDSNLVMKDATHMVTGNLTLKGVTKSITFPAKITVTDNNVTADANFNIDRTQWGIVYGNDKSLGDKFIRPEVNLQLHVVANPQM